MKRKIAIVAGGDSSEWQVSMRSAAGLDSFIPSEKYEKYIVVIIGQDWHVELPSGEKMPIDKNDFSFTYQGEKIKFDFAYITIHGTPGENGILQGYFRLLNIPFSCCDVLQAALTFDKYACNNYLRSFGIRVANSIVLRAGESVTDEQVMQEIGLPCFIKPSVGGSSFGVTKVTSAEQIASAVEAAFAESDHVLIEECIVGREMGCGVVVTADREILLPITEIVSKRDFFDYEAKYTAGLSDEMTPAPISEEIKEKLNRMTLEAYRACRCSGIVRIDFIVTEAGEPYMIEINSIPGMSSGSIVPKQVREAGMTLGELYDIVIEDSLNRFRK